MKGSSLDSVIDAVLYEGYILYPYRASSSKNQRERFTFGRVYPRDYSIAQNGAEPWLAQTECLAIAPPRKESAVKVSARFLHPTHRTIGLISRPSPVWSDDITEQLKTVPRLEVDDQVFVPWYEAVERSVDLPEIPIVPGQKTCLEIPFQFPSSRVAEPIRDKGDLIKGAFVRRQESLMGLVQVEVEPLGNCYKISVRVRNQTPTDAPEDQEAIIERTFASTHVILRLNGGEFISSMDPPVKYKKSVADCKNIGVWPVLIGDGKAGDWCTMLASPIILYDYPEIAPESRGTLFDGTEIDEILNLRILTMTDDEKREMRNVDEAARRLLERTESLVGEDFWGMHGKLRSESLSPEQQIFGNSKRIEGVTVQDTYLKAGDPVRIRPKTRSDIMDIALNGKTAVIEALEEDAEGHIHLALVVHDDPGRDLGLLRQPGHRFFYSVDEVEPVKEER